MSGIINQIGSRSKIVGASVFPLGSESSPSITFAGRTDTGMFSSLNNELDLVTDGSTGLHIGPSGHVGIGNEGPDQRLSVFNDTSSTTCKIQGTVAAETTMIVQGGGTGAVNVLDIRDGAGAQKFIVRQNGNVGIGTAAVTSTSGQAGPLLKLSGADAGGGPGISLENTNITGTPEWEMYIAGNQSLYLTDDGVARMVIDNAGNVGLGTASPEDTLHIYDSSTSEVAIKFGLHTWTQYGRIHYTGGSEALSLQSVSSTTSNANGYITMQTAQNGATPVERMRIDSEGRLIHNGADTYTSSFYTSAQTVINFDIIVGSWQGMVLIQCGAGYYPATAYTCSLYGWYAVRMSDSSLGQITNIATQDSTTNNNVGKWSVEKYDSTTLRITKERGGTGDYTNNPPSNTPGSSATLRGFVKVTFRGA